MSPLNPNRTYWAGLLTELGSTYRTSRYSRFPVRFVLREHGLYVSTEDVSWVGTVRSNGREPLYFGVFETERGTVLAAAGWLELREESWGQHSRILVGAGSLTMQTRVPEEGQDGTP